LAAVTRRMISPAIHVRWCPVSAGCFPPTCASTKLANTEQLLTKMLVEELGYLLECLLRLGRADVAIILRVRLALEDLKHGFDAGLAQLSMDAHGIAKKQVARAAGENGRREAVHVAEKW